MPAELGKDVRRLSSPKPIGSYVLDTVQIYFPWDDDLYTFLKERGFGKGGLGSKKLPLVYTDNCESTTGEKARARKYVILPKYFGMSYEQLGWEQTSRPTEPIVPAEKPRLVVSLLNKGASLEFRLKPSDAQGEQYHLEYSSMAEFGTMYSNWSIFVLRHADLHDLSERLARVTSHPAAPISDVAVDHEKKQNQREEFDFVRVPLEFYKFSIGEFAYAKRYFEMNGVSALLPSLVYRDAQSYKEKMEPFLKIGVVHTTEEQGFESRAQQCALKIAQPKATIAGRGKKAKVKGFIEEDERYENYFVVPTLKLLVAVQKIEQLFFEQGKKGASRRPRS